MIQNAPLVSVIIVNHNGIDFVDACLRSVLNNSYTNIEVIFIDNASTDGSLEYVKKIFGSDRRLKFIENSGSFGPAVGRNKGITVAKGKYIVFLDNDVEVDSSWLVELIKVFEFNPAIGAAQSKLLRTEPRNEFDCAGDYLTPFGFLSERANSAKDMGQFDYICDIFSAKSAASIIRRDVLDKIGGFDESYYMYLEETDLSWRVWLAGYRVIFIPKSIVYHAYGTKKKARKQYYSKYVVRYDGCRNYISTLIKNFGIRNLLIVLPIHLILWLSLSIMFFLKLKLNDVFWIMKAIIWNLINVGYLLKKRRFVQKSIRKIDDNEIFNKVGISRPLKYYLQQAVSYSYGKSYQ